MKLLSRLDAAIEFHFGSLTGYGLLIILAAFWQRFQTYFLDYCELNFSFDISRMKFPEDKFEKTPPHIEEAFAAMRELEAGAVANPTENECD